jgi:hypothetical protein
MAKIKTGKYAGQIGTFFMDNELISVFDKTSGMWVVVSVSVGYEIV